MLRDHTKTFFVFEKQPTVMTDGGSGDKAYKIRREAKLVSGALLMFCSRRKVLA
jgi:hypothetical protein